MTETFLDILLTTLLVFSMLGAGLKISAANVRALLTSSDLFLRVLVVNFFAVPLLGILMVTRIGFSPEMNAAFALIAFTPGSVGTIQFTSRYKGYEALAGTMAVLLSALAVFFSPAMLAWVIPEEYPVRLPYGTAAMFVLLAMFAPLLAGYWIRRLAEGLADRMAPWAVRLSTLFYAAYIAFYYYDHRAEAHPVALMHLGYMLGFVVICLLMGFTFGGPGPISRAIVANATSMRQVSLTLLIASHTFASDQVEANLTAFTLLMIGVNALFAVGMRIYLKVKR